MAGVLNLYTEASVRGRLLRKGPKPNRTRIGPAFAAWAGWHDCASTDRPTIAGQAYIGTHGTQTAEFMGVSHGLSAALGFYEPRREAARPAVLTLHVDNGCVYLLMVGEWSAHELAPLYRVATDLTARLFGLGIEVGVVKVPETDATHKVDHTMSKNAHKQVLTREDWRPRDDRPEPVRKPYPRLCEQRRGMTTSRSDNQMDSRAVRRESLRRAGLSPFRPLLLELLAVGREAPAAAFLAHDAVTLELLKASHHLAGSDAMRACRLGRLRTRRSAVAKQSERVDPGGRQVLGAPHRGEITGMTVREPRPRIDRSATRLQRYSG